MRSARTVVAEKRRVAARSCGRGRGRWSCRGRGRGRWSNDGGRERRAWSRARTVVEQSDVRGAVIESRAGSCRRVVRGGDRSACVGLRSCRGRGGGRDGEDGTRDATAARCGGRGARGRECASRIAWVQAVAVASVAKRGSAAQGSVVSGDGKDGREKRRWSCQCRVAVESAHRSGRAARRQIRHRGIVVEMSPHHLTRRTEEPGRAGGRAGGRAAEGTAEPA